MPLPMPMNYKHNTMLVFNKNKSVGFITSSNLTHPAVIGVFASDEWLYDKIYLDREFMSTLKVYPVQLQATTKKLLNFTEDNLINFITKGVF